MSLSYNIKQSDLFNADLYPEVIAELKELQRTSYQMNTPFKEQVVISFLKNHSITSRWLESDREICKLMTSRAVAVSHLESLFNCSRNNQRFLEGLERYIKEQVRKHQ
ncbi:MAG TPA: hypothetical protein VGD40_06470 [Chryseosolibacter sp.]